MKKFFTLIAVAVMALASQAGSLTVADGEWYAQAQPVLGLYADTEGTTVQSIYPASMLTEMAGNQITEITFYTVNDWYVNNGYGDSTDPTDFINFEGARFTLGLMEVENGQFDENAPEAYVGATVVAEFEPEFGAYIVKIVLDQPFNYTGKDLLVETVVVEAGDYGQTYFIGDAVEGYKCGFVSYFDAWYEAIDAYATDFLPKATFTYQPAGSLVQADAPEIGVTYGVEGNHVAFVNINSGEENATIYYSYDGENWMVYEGELLFTENGTYTVYAYVTVPGKLDSAVNFVQFVVTPRTGMTDVMTGKTIASQRYYNVAGQEMQEANGLTIVVTTYTDGTTNTVKVVK